MKTPAPFFSLLSLISWGLAGALVALPVHAGTAQGQAPAPTKSTQSLIRLLNSGKVVTRGEYVLPIQIWQDLILVRMQINGVEGLMIWDSGFSASALDTAYASQVKLSAVKQRTSATDGNGKPFSMSLSSARRVKLGGIEIRDTPFTSIDIQKAIGRETQVMGIIGSSIIKKLNWRFDFDKGLVTVSSKAFKAEGTTLHYAYDRFNNWQIVLGINEAQDWAMIDFGYNGDDIDLPMAALPVFKDAKKATVHGFHASSVTGLADEATSYLIKDYRLTVGKEAVPLPVQMNAFLTESGAIPKIGNRFFRRFNPAVNATLGEIILQPRSTPIEPMPDKGYGFTLGMHEGKAIIMTRTSNPNLARNPELKLRDEVLAINDQSIADISASGHLRDLQIQLLLDGRPMTLKMANGEHVTLLPEKNTFE